MGLPKRNWRIAALIALGYPEGKQSRKQKRKSLASLISWNRFGQKP
jgi:hypothetical protein